MRLDVLRSNLCFIHGTTLASEGMLEAAIAKSHGDLKDYFVRHLNEERGHLQMLEQVDLKELGVRDIVKFPAAAELAGAQYYYIAHEHPALLLGYMAALEGVPTSEAAVDALEAEYNVVLACLRHHAVHDPKHSEELQAQIETLEPELKARVRANELWTIRQLAERILPMIYAEAKQFSRRI